MVKIKNLRYYIILVLFLISLISSIVLSFTSVSLICSTISGCEVIHYSAYNSFLGVQNSDYGIIIFAFLSLLTISYFINPTQNKKALINLSIILGSILALYFLYVQHFILEAYCRYCLIVDFSVILCLILIIPELRRGFSSIKIKNEEDITAGS